MNPGVDVPRLSGEQKHPPQNQDQRHDDTATVATTHSAVTLKRSNVSINPSTTFTKDPTIQDFLGDCPKNQMACFQCKTKVLLLMVQKMVEGAENMPDDEIIRQFNEFYCLLQQATNQERVVARPPPSSPREIRAKNSNDEKISGLTGNNQQSPMVATVGAIGTSDCNQRNFSETPDPKSVWNIPPQS